MSVFLVSKSVSMSVDAIRESGLQVSGYVRRCRECVSLHVRLHVMRQHTWGIVHEAIHIQQNTQGNIHRAYEFIL